MFVLFPKKIKHKIKAHKPILTLYIFGNVFLFLFTLHTVCFKFIEKSTWLIAIYETWQVATTVGYGTGTAQTAIGICITMFVGTLNIAFLGLFIDFASLSIIGTPAFTSCKSSSV